MSYDLESKENIETLQNLNDEQENVLNQLNDIESILDSFLDLQGYGDSKKKNTTESSFYDLQEQITKQIGDIQNSISKLDEKVKIIYSDKKELESKLERVKDAKQVDAITIILNEFYQSLQSLKYYQVSIFFNILE